MATSTSSRIPWRALTWATSAKPSTQLFRAQCSATSPVQYLSRRHASDRGSSPSQLADPTAVQPTFEHSVATSPNTVAIDPRLPRAVQAVYLRPLRRTPTYGVPVCDLQLRSYNVRNLEFFCDFALRAAYYLNLPASGPVPLPRITERWTVPKSSFIYKKSQENFERRTMRRLIQIKDGHVDNVQIWLAFLRKHSYYGIGMKANVWEFTKLGVGKEMDMEMEKMSEKLDETWDRFAFRPGTDVEKKVVDFMNREDRKAAAGLTAPMMRPPH